MIYSRAFSAHFYHEWAMREDKDFFALRGKVCRRIVQSACLNDEWSMQRFAAINRYLAGLGGIQHESG